MTLIHTAIGTCNQAGPGMLQGVLLVLTVDEDGEPDPHTSGRHISGILRSLGVVASPKGGVVAPVAASLI